MGLNLLQETQAHTSLEKGLHRLALQFLCFLCPANSETEPPIVCIRILDTRAVVTLAFGKRGVFSVEVTLARLCSCRKWQGGQLGKGLQIAAAMPVMGRSGGRNWAAWASEVTYAPIHSNGGSSGGTLACSFPSRWSTWRRIKSPYQRL